MGRVFLAEDTALHRKVALKFLPESLEENPEARERFLTEAKSVAALDHPYICKIYEIGEVNGRAFIAMEYIEGVTLAEKLFAGPLRVPHILELGVELTDALEAAHKKGIVHRDIKTSNIIVTPDGHVKILDFGVAKRVAMEALSNSQVDTYSGRLTSSSGTPGTVIYMSPEQVRGEAVDGRTDIFSLGIVLYEMATGTIPFQGATSGLIYDAILNLGARPPRTHNPNLPEGLELLILKSLEKDRDHRFQTQPGSKQLGTELRPCRRWETSIVRSDSWKCLTSFWKRALFPAELRRFTSAMISGSRDGWPMSSAMPAWLSLAIRAGTIGSTRTSTGVAEFSSASTQRRRARTLTRRLPPARAAFGWMTAIARSHPNRPNPHDERHGSSPLRSPF